MKTSAKKKHFLLRMNVVKKISQAFEGTPSFSIWQRRYKPTFGSSWDFLQHRLCAAKSFSSFFLYTQSLCCFTRTFCLLRQMMKTFGCSETSMNFLCIKFEVKRTSVSCPIVQSRSIQKYCIWTTCACTNQFMDKDWIWLWSNASILRK